MGMLTKAKLRAASALGPIVVDIEGASLTERERARIRHPLAGAVILFTRNFESREALAELCAEIHSLRPGMPIAVDHEGGRVQRFRDGFTEIPAMRSLSRTADPIRAFSAAGFVLASELRACGVDFSFTPVLDLDYERSGVIGSRSFGATPAEVARNAAALIAGLRQAGMGSCGKHFPGHGWAQADSHAALPTDERSIEAVMKDLSVYETLAGLLDSVMTAHVSYAAFDGGVATYEPRLIRDILRGCCGFSGLLFSDDLSMKGAAGPDGRLLSPLERTTRALEAGCDAVLYCSRPDEVDEVLGSLSWSRPAVFSERLARIMPDGADPLDRAELEASEQYRAAKAVLEAVAAAG